MKKSIAVIGQGFVGGSLTTVMDEKGIQVYVYDKIGKVAPGGHNTISETVKHSPNSTLTSISTLVRAMEENTGVQNFAGIYFVCVPTPMNEDGSCNTSIVEGVLTELSAIARKPSIAVIKSTVPPGSTEAWNKKFAGTGLRVVFCPEFLREASALDDMRNQDRIILGGPKEAVNQVRDLFRMAFSDVVVRKTSSTNAELVKYTINNFLAVKVSLANELSQICEKLFEAGQDADYDRVIELATLDDRLGNSHWKVPGPMPADDDSGKLLRGFGGSCFIKDIRAMIFLSKTLGIDPKVMVGAWEKNLEVRPEKDWEKLVGRAVTSKKKV